MQLPKLEIASQRVSVRVGERGKVYLMLMCAAAAAAEFVLAVLAVAVDVGHVAQLELLEVRTLAEDVEELVDGRRVAVVVPREIEHRQRGHQSRVPPKIERREHARAEQRRVAVKSGWFADDDSV